RWRSNMMRVFIFAPLALDRDASLHCPAILAIACTASAQVNVQVVIDEAEALKNTIDARVIS
ncbi:MAG TPA: hypothetical protein VFT08_03415, partial [Pyrinomonadaceae bacterium]|nr:hypothetical protein [Pyrinomonadaceae bacterium]